MELGAVRLHLSSHRKGDGSACTLDKVFQLAPMSVSLDAEERMKFSQ